MVLGRPTCMKPPTTRRNSPSKAASFHTVFSFAVAHLLAYNHFYFSSSCDATATMSVEALLAQLDAQRDAYIDTFQRAHKAFADSIAKATPAGTRGRAASLEVPSLPQSPTINLPGGHRPSFSRSPTPLNYRDEPFHGGFNSNYDASTLTDSDSDSDEDENLYAQEHLPAQSFDHEHLREHLKSYDFDAYGRQILAGIINDRGRLKDPSLFPANDAYAEEKKNYSHYQVFDIGQDGIPTQIATSSDGDHTVTKAQQVWHAIKDINHGTKDNYAVGRITVAREPSAVLFGAMHLTCNKMFDMDELYRQLIDFEASSVELYRAFEDDERRRRSVVFSFEYYTIIGDGRRPMSWQISDEDQLSTNTHLPITRCSSVVALSLYGDPIRKIRNSARRAKKREGGIYDPWQAWQVLNIQCFPDWKAKTDVHGNSKRYVNGPEAFLRTVLAEYKDAQKRFEEINKAISKLITPPHDFIFDKDQRDARLFEDKNFTYTRRYFWAHQTLGSMNDSIQAMIEAYEDNFPDELWEGKHRTLWPLAEQDETGRNDYFRKRLKALKMSFTREINGLRTLQKENNDRRNEIRFLRDQLFSGTSVMESRKSVELSEITIQQGHNIKLLTLVNIFFLPLTFVSSIFGMTNMPTAPHYWMFAITLCAVCIPFFLLIGSLNTKEGYRWWGAKLEWLKESIRRWRKAHSKKDEGPKAITDLLRSMSAEQGMEGRLGRRKSLSEKRGFVVEVKQPEKSKQKPRAQEDLHLLGGGTSNTENSTDETMARRRSIYDDTNVVPPANVRIK